MPRTAKKPEDKTKNGASADVAVAEPGVARVETVVRTVTTEPTAPRRRSSRAPGRIEKPLTGRPISILYRAGSGKGARWVLVGRVESGPVPDDDALRDAIPVIRERGGLVKMTCPAGGQTWRNVAAMADESLMLQGDVGEPSIQTLDMAPEPQSPPASPWGPPPGYWYPPAGYPSMAPVVAPQVSAKPTDWVGILGAVSPLLVAAFQALPSLMRSGSPGSVSEMVEGMARLQRLSEEMRPQSGQEDGGGMLGQIVQLAPLLSLLRGSPAQEPQIPLGFYQPQQPVAPPSVSQPLSGNGGAHATRSQPQPSPEPSGGDGRLRSALAEAGLDVDELSEWLERIPGPLRIRALAQMVKTLDAQGKQPTTEDDMEL